MALHQPGGVGGFPEPEQGLMQFLHCADVSHPQEIFLEGTDESFGTAIALWGTHNDRRACHAEKAELSLEHIGHGLAAVVVTDGKTTGNIPGKGS